VTSEYGWSSTEDERPWWHLRAPVRSHNRSPDPRDARDARRPAGMASTWAMG
jgi:hypothetical protein